jgi:hypothetical protein
MVSVSYVVVRRDNDVDAPIAAFIDRRKAEQFVAFLREIQEISGGALGDKHDKPRADYRIREFIHLDSVQDFLGELVYPRVRMVILCDQAHLTYKGRTMLPFYTRSTMPTPENPVVIRTYLVRPGTRNQYQNLANRYRRKYKCDGDVLLVEITGYTTTDLKENVVKYLESVNATPDDELKEELERYFGL